MSWPDAASSTASEQDGVEHYTVAYYVGLSALEYTRRDGAENVFLTFEFESVAGVGSTLEAGYYVVGRSEYVNDFAFSFIAPLEAKKNVYFIVHWITDLCVVWC